MWPLLLLLVASCHAFCIPPASVAPCGKPTTVPLVDAVRPTDVYGNASFAWDPSGSLYVTMMLADAVPGALQWSSLYLWSDTLAIGHPNYVSTDSGRCVTFVVNLDGVCTPASPGCSAADITYFLVLYAQPVSMVVSGKTLTTVGAFMQQQGVVPLDNTRIASGVCTELPIMSCHGAPPPSAKKRRPPPKRP